jgi:hypothetical protein
MKQVCEHHNEYAYKVERLLTRMDRIELGIVALLAGLVIQLWMLWDLPGQVQQDRRRDVVAPAHAESLVRK